MSQINKIIYVIVMWGLLIYVGYNVLTVEATTDKTPKEICKGFDSGKWDDDSNKCEFSKQGIKDEDDVEFDHYISENGLYENYLAGIAVKDDDVSKLYVEGTNVVRNELEGKLTPEQKQSLAKDNSDWEYAWEDTESNPVKGTPSYVNHDEVEEPNQIEDWGNTVTDDSYQKQQEYFEARAEANGYSTSNDAEEADSQEANNNDNEPETSSEEATEEEESNEEEESESNEEEE